GGCGPSAVRPPSPASRSKTAAAPAAKLLDMAIIEAEHLQERYGETGAGRDVSFAVEQGEIFGILGPNGAGKTTTVECIAGLRTPDAGSITVLGRPPRDPRLRRLVGVQLQESQLPEKMSVREALELYSAFYPKPVDWRALAREL